MDRHYNYIIIILILVNDIIIIYLIMLTLNNYYIYYYNYNLKLNWWSPQTDKHSPSRKQCQAQNQNHWPCNQVAQALTAICYTASLKKLVPIYSGCFGGND